MPAISRACIRTRLEWIGLGVVLMLLLSRLDYHTIMDQAPSCI